MPNTSASSANCLKRMTPAAFGPEAALSDPLTDADDDAVDTTDAGRARRALAIPSYITLRSELNEAEQIGIDHADVWAFSRRRGDVLDEDFLRQLQQADVRRGRRWSPGPSRRSSDSNIGVDAWQIGPELHQLLGDVRYWIEHETYAPDEIAVRFHHRLVFIHPFPNGNGPTVRDARGGPADQFSLGGARFTWGSRRPRCDRGVASALCGCPARRRRPGGSNLFIAFARSSVASSCRPTLICG